MQAMSPECLALGHIIERIGDKWTVVVVGVLADGPMRFNSILRTVPALSHRMLTLTLRRLERDGLLQRTSYPTMPPRVEYALTAIGRSLTAPLTALASWAAANRPDIEAAQASYDSKPRPLGI